MNYRLILYILGWVSIVTGGALIFPVLVGVFYNEEVWKTYFLFAIIAIVLGFFVVLKKPRRNDLSAKEGFVVVALVWIILSLFGAMPFYFGGDIPSYLDAVFETASGFSTTGASILTNIEALSHASLFWRSFTHWIGGMGVLVFILAIMPVSSGGLMRLMRAESPGPQVGKFVPKIRETALILYSIYGILTVFECVFLMLGGMPWFDSITTAFATAGTGGFSIRGASMGFYNNYLQTVVTIFMILFGVNFNIYYYGLRKDLKSIARDEEFRTYLLIIAFSILVITFNIKNSFYRGEFYPAFHDASFSVASIISTTGFGTADFNLWPRLSKYVLVILMFIGASAGSTGGGLKVSRLIIIVKSVFYELVSIVKPRSVKDVKINGSYVDFAVLKRTRSFFALSMIVFVVSSFIISFDGFDMTTTVTSVISALNNIGPGLELVGPTGNFAMFSNVSKVVLIFDMLAGRLELFPMLVLFTPVTWRGMLATVKRRIRRMAK